MAETARLTRPVYKQDLWVRFSPIAPSLNVEATHLKLIRAPLLQTLLHLTMESTAGDTGPSVQAPNGQQVDGSGFKLKFCTVCASNQNR